MFLSVVVVTFTGLFYHVYTYSTSRVKSPLHTVTLGGSKAITTISDGSQDIPRKLAKLPTLLHQLECLSSFPHQQSPVLYSQTALIFLILIGSRGRHLQL
jgi:hypothetical protein